MKLSSDFKDLLEAFAAQGVEYLVVGGYAVAFHGHPRFTRDLDIWLGPSPENLARAVEALRAFGAPDATVQGLSDASPEDVVWMGLPPVRIDLLKGVPGGDFEAVYPRRVVSAWDGVPVAWIAREDLLAIKRASGRPLDLADAAALELDPPT